MTKFRQNIVLSIIKHQNKNNCIQLCRIYMVIFNCTNKVPLYSFALQYIAFSYSVYICFNFNYRTTSLNRARLACCSHKSARRQISLVSNSNFLFFTMLLVVSTTLLYFLWNLEVCANFLENVFYQEICTLLITFHLSIHYSFSSIKIFAGFLLMTVFKILLFSNGPI